MVTESSSKGDFAAAALLLVPPSVRGAIIEGMGLAESAGFRIDTVVRIEEGGAEFSRARLFGVVREVLAGGTGVAEVEAQDGAIWRVTHDAVEGVTIARGGKTQSLPEFACFAPDARTRVDWFERQRAAYWIGDEPCAKWRVVLSDRPLEDGELDELLEEFRLTPQHWVATMRRQLRGPGFGPADLVPTDLRYFDRITGEPPEGIRLPEFVNDVLTSHASAVMAWDEFEGLRLLFAPVGT